MDRTERLDSLHAVLLATQQGVQSEIWTAVPGILVAYEPSQMTCTVQVAIQAQVSSSLDGTKAWLSIPPLLDCPVVFPSGGKCILSFPLAPGDECLVIFSSRCMDGWWTSGKESPPPFFRMHNLSDGFVIAGVRSKPKIVSNLHATAVELRSEDGQVHISLDPTSKEIAIQADKVRITGDLIVSGKITGLAETALSHGVSLLTHTHPSPGGTTGVPNAV